MSFKLGGKLSLKKDKSIKDRVQHSRLWTITSKRPKSQRFFQVRFEGFDPKGRNKVEQWFNIYIDFFNSTLKYLRLKIRNILRGTRRTGVLAVNSVPVTKAFVVRKMIWSRGRLGRPIVTSFVMVVAFMVFMIGEVFNSSKLVNSQEIDPDYLASVTDIIPQRTTAITTVPDSRKQSEPFAYVIEDGDTLSSIGNKFKISVDALKYVNNLSDYSVLNVGDQIVIPPVTGLIHTVAKGDTLSSIANKYSVAPQAIADFNYILNTSSLVVGSELVIPDAKIPQNVVVPSPSYLAPLPSAVDPNASSGWCMWPTTTRIITQYFSWYHNGLDIANPSGNAMPPLYACAGGVVTRSGWDPWGLGLHVRIDHGNGYETVYGHMSRVDIGYGDTVAKGQALGLMGNTGRSTGPHVHFTINFNGVSQNPLNYIN